MLDAEPIDILLAKTSVSNPTCYVELSDATRGDFLGAIRDAIT